MVENKNTGKMKHLRLFEVNAVKLVGILLYFKCVTVLPLNDIFTSSALVFFFGATIGICFTKSVFLQRETQGNENHTDLK